MQEIVTDGITGLLFNPGDPTDLAAKAEWAWSHPAEMRAMGRRARAEYAAKYTEDRNYEVLVELWNRLGIETYHEEVECS
jgi:glycosyltransferase involved in cell wall biosynthesis